MLPDQTSSLATASHHCANGLCDNTNHCEHKHLRSALRPDPKTTQQMEALPAEAVCQAEAMAVAASEAAAKVLEEKATAEVAMEVAVMVAVMAAPTVVLQRNGNELHRCHRRTCP